MRLLNKQFVKHTDRILTALAAGLIFSAGVAGAQFPVTAEQAAELVQAQVVAGADEDAAAAEAAAESVVQFDPLAPEVYGEGTISQIVVQGNQRLSTNTILTLLPVQIGDDFQPLRLDAALKALYATGQFADVRLDRQGSVLVIQVRENVLINQIAFEGNQAIGDSDLRLIIETAPRTVLTRTKVARDIQKMKGQYEREGRLLVLIEPKIIPLTGNRANLVFEINEGSRARVDAVNFVGNTAYTDRRLRSAILTRQTNLLRNLLQGDGFAPDRIAVDRRFLTEYYQSRGYAEFEVISAVAEQTPEKRGFIVTFTVKEGLKYRFGRVRIANNLPGVDTSRLVNQLKVRTGRTYDVLDVEETREDMIERVSSQGFPFVDVVVTEDSDPSRGVVDLTFTIEEGPRLFVERISIAGNERTADDVIRREFRLSEGDAFSVSKLQRSQERLLSLGFFSSVELEPESVRRATKSPSIRSLKSSEPANCAWAEPIPTQRAFWVTSRLPTATSVAVVSGMTWTSMPVLTIKKHPSASPSPISSGVKSALEPRFFTKTRTSTTSMTAAKSVRKRRWATSFPSTCDSRGPMP